MNKIRWGVLSTARINRSVLPAFAFSRRSTLAALASRDGEKGALFASEWNIPQVYGSYDELLADPNIDVIYNPLPNDLHAAWTIRALQAGKHVLCEKPLALTIDEVDAIAAAAQAAGRVVAEAFMYRHHPMTLQVQEWIASGLLGEIKYLHGSFTFHLTQANNIRLKPENGGGSLWDIGCYPVSYAALVMGGPPAEAAGCQHIGPSGVDASFTGQLRYASGAAAQVFSSFELPFQMGIDIYGSEGAIHIPAPFKPPEPASLVIRQGDRESTYSFHTPHLYLGEVEDMEAAILDGRPPRMTLAENRQIIATLNALYRSARENRVQPVGA